MKVIALRGKCNTGKSDSLKRLIQMFSCKDAKILAFGLLQPVNKDDVPKITSDITICAQTAPSFNGDIFAVIDYKGVCIGISTQGDDRYWLEKAYERICSSIEETTPKEIPDIFVCAIRSYGGTNDFIADVCTELPVIVYDKASIDTIGNADNFGAIEAEQTKLNCIQAKILFDYFEQVISSGG